MPTPLLLSFSLYVTRAHRYLHSFPTRRSSDLHGRGVLRTRPADPSRDAGAARRAAVEAEQDHHLHHPRPQRGDVPRRSEEHTSELQSRGHLVCRLLLEKKKHNKCETTSGTDVS